MVEYRTQKFPKSRIASIDVYEIGKQKHHVTALIELDVTETRKKIKQYNKVNPKISFTAWLIKAISLTINDYKQVASFLKGNRNVLIFDEVHISILVEKNIDNEKVPIPLIIENACEKSILSITNQIKEARSETLTQKDIVIQRRSKRLERLYYYMPGFIRKAFWKYLLGNPVRSFQKMGNVAITSIGMFGNVKGWFIPTSVHPICFGISSITRKPVVLNDQVEIREVMNMTVLLDHDVVDGAPMARFISKLSDNIEKGFGL